MKCILSFFTILICLSVEHVSAVDHPWRSEDSRPGYSADVNKESEQSGEILYFVENPYKNDLRLQEQIFDKTISKEITGRYREQFGRTEAEIVYERTPYLTNNFTESDSNVFNQEEYRNRQRKFGEFVGKRLIEYHFETKAKNDPTLKAVYDTKQKVEKLDVSFSKNWKLRAKYRISSNNVMTEIRNPFMDVLVRTELNGDDTVVTLQKEFLKTNQFLTDYYADGSRWDIIFKKKFPKFDFTLTYTPFRELNLGENNIVDESLFIAGVGLPFPY